MLIALGLMVAAPGIAQDSGETREETEEAREQALLPVVVDDATPTSELVLVPVFAAARAFRIRLETELLPAGGLEDRAEVDTYSPGLQVRVGIPVSERVGVQIVARYNATLYEFDGAPDFFANGLRASRPFDDLHDLRLSLQAAAQLNSEWSLFFEGERWSLLGELSAGSRWEDDAFDNGFSGGGGIALGYELPRRLRLGLGVALRRRIARSGVSVSPIVNARLRLTDDLLLRTRGRGGQIEYQWSSKLNLYAAVFETGRSWRLDRRSGVPSRTVLNDSQLRVGVGAEWRMHRNLRLQLEAGTVARRELSVESEGSGGVTLSRVDGDPSAYLTISLELRP